MKYLSTLVAALAAAQTISATPVDVKRDQPGLNIKLSQVGNTKIKAVVTNTGSDPVTFVHRNFFHDSAPVKKVSLFRNNEEVKFEGVKIRVKSKDLSNDALTTLAAGATLEDVFDLAHTSDLSAGGPVTLRTKGFIPTTTGNKVTGSIAFSSNELKIDVDGAEAAKIATVGKSIARRTEVSCSASQSSILETALENTVKLANAAADAASSGAADEYLQTFFKSTSSDVVDEVVGRLQAVAEEASSTTSGATSYSCTDEYGYCEPNVLAYTLPALNLIANCDIYYSYLPDLASTCYDQDQATTTLHELTHAPGVYSPGTDDLGYGYSAATSLSTDEALNNADSFALFAQAIDLSC